MNIYQPNEFELYQRPKQVVDSSNSNWIWKTFFAYEGAGKDLKIFNNMNWKNIFHETKRFIHKEQNHINVLRSSSEGEYNILQGRSEIQGTFNLVDDSDNECSIGFEMNVDGVLFKINEDHLNKINFSELNKDTQMRLKFEYFSYQLQNSSKLKEIANKFTIDWIHKTSVSMLTAVALKKKIKLHESQSYLDDVRVVSAIKVIKSMYSSDLVHSDDEIAPETKLERKMTDIWSDNILVTEIKHLENVLWDDLNDENFKQWLKEKYVKSLSEGLLKSFQLLMQDFVDDEVDVDSFVDETGTYILLTENSPGGIGFIEEFVKRVQVDEKSFQKGILFSFEHCEKEYFSNSILKLLKESKEEEIKDLFKKFRTSKTHNEYDKCKDLLIETLKSLSIENSQDLVTFVTSKLFQNIFNKDLNLGNIYDKWVLGINKFKTNKEKQLKIPINENIFVYFLSTLKPVQSKLKRWMNEISSDPLNEAQVYSILNNLIISNCHDTCPQCLVNSNKFNFDLSPSRELALEFLTKDFKKDKKINFEDNWIENFKSELVSSSQVTLVVSEDKLENLSFAMQNMLTEPIEKDYLFLYPTIESFSKKKQIIIISNFICAEVKAL